MVLQAFGLLLSKGRVGGGVRGEGGRGGGPPPPPQFHDGIVHRASLHLENVP